MGPPYAHGPFGRNWSNWLRPALDIDHKESYIGNLLLSLCVLLFSTDINGSFILHYPTDKIVDSTAFGIPVDGALVRMGKTCRRGLILKPNHLR